MKTAHLPIFKKTKRLVLRPLELHDFENWAQAYSSMRPPQNEWDETNWVESELTLPKFKAHLKKNLLWRSQDHFYEFGVFRKDDGLLIGTVSLMDISRQIFQNAYLGYRIYNNHWGHGYATEACHAAIEIAFKDLKLHRIEAGIMPTNKRSIKVAKNIGLRKESLSPRRLYVHGKWVDLLLYAGTSEEFGFKFRFPKTKTAK
ncbi:GNAT family N-acetyltransferase [Bdellovibrio svalbardensis]|uniref:GNAT family N-acetyltransferase n=1 Tax=Bdellovibrio svalbardensis TaxID=2972972 RepID=A0ABT6DGR3_9BACT|nr:GNAT family protein [Bdellovibrio svalbardensis]MDG0816040.1 GNAT family N-acetyltransferase [Bdellovibrio svalbardensis]